MRLFEARGGRRGERALTRTRACGAEAEAWALAGAWARAGAGRAIAPRCLHLRASLAAKKMRLPLDAWALCRKRVLAAQTVSLRAPFGAVS